MLLFKTHWYNLKYAQAEKSKKYKSVRIIWKPLTHFAPISYSVMIYLPGRVAQSVTCLATDACLTADPGVASSIPARSHTFVEIDHEIIFYGHSPPFH